jgi:hypothetical protein
MFFTLQLFIILIDYIYLLRNRRIDYHKYRLGEGVVILCLFFSKLRGKKVIADKKE